MADSVGGWGEDGGREKEDGAGGGQGGKPKKKREMKQGRRMRWVETRNAMTTRTDGEGCSGALGKFGCTRYISIHGTALKGVVHGTLRHSIWPSSTPRNPFTTASAPAQRPTEYLYPLVTLIL